MQWDREDIQSRELLLSRVQQGVRSAHNRGPGEGTGPRQLALGEWASEMSLHGYDWSPFNVLPEL